MGTVTCGLGELETAARRQREEEQAFGGAPAFREERTPGAFREASVSFFTSPSAAWALGTTAQLGPPVRRPHHRDSGVSMGLLPPGKQTEPSANAGAMIRRVTPPAFDTPLCTSMRGQLHLGSREAGENLGARHSEHLVSSFLVCTL